MVPEVRLQYCCVLKLPSIIAYLPIESYLVHLSESPITTSTNFEVLCFGMTADSR